MSKLEYPLRYLDVIYAMDDVYKSMNFHCFSYKRPRRMKKAPDPEHKSSLKEVKEG